MEKKMKLDNYEKIMEIVKRADNMNLMAHDRMTLSMDLMYVDEQYNLRLDELLKTDNYNFSHDIVGIQNNFNRQTFELENCFLPRFAG